jgi:acetoin utilization deacetylase AcuC-like enzyme
MNERIKELAEQATKKYDRLGNDIPFAQPDLEKFADSIVWECMKICEDVMKKDNSALACWSEIKGTFRS